MDRQKKSARQHGNAARRVGVLCKYYTHSIHKLWTVVKRENAAKTAAGLGGGR